jgi:hypothetical protein
MSYTDLFSNNSNKVISIDFEKSFDLSKENFDFALCMNTLEHIYNHQQFMDSIFKSLKKSGTLTGVVPFLHFYHEDPNDYFRYTHTALERILTQAGFEEIKIKKIGVGAFTVFANMVSKILIFKPLILIWWFSSIIIDSLLNKIWSKNKDVYGALFFYAQKKRH